MAFNIFFSIETFFSMLLVLTVGPDLVSQDLRFNAMPMYFSRPIRRVDYFLGKLGVIGVFLASVAIAPAVAAYILGVAFSLDVTVIRDTWRLLVGSIAFGLVVVFSAGTLMLAISSMSRNSRLVGAAWVGLWLVSNVSADVLILSARRQWCPLVSYTANLDRLREGLLDTNSARRRFLSLYEAGRETGLQAARAALPFGRRRRFFGLPRPRHPLRLVCLRMIPARLTRSKTRTCPLCCGPRRTSDSRGHGRPGCSVSCSYSRRGPSRPASSRWTA